MFQSAVDQSTIYATLNYFKRLDYYYSAIKHLLLTAHSITMNTKRQSSVDLQREKSCVSVSELDSSDRGKKKSVSTLVYLGI